MPFGMKAVEAITSRSQTFTLEASSPMPFGMKAVEASLTNALGQVIIRPRHQCLSA